MNIEQEDLTETQEDTNSGERTSATKRLNLCAPINESLIKRWGMQGSFNKAEVRKIFFCILTSLVVETTWFNPGSSMSSFDAFNVLSDTNNIENTTYTTLIHN